jgi:hypothetical protein
MPTNFKFLSQNEVNTTTQFSVDSNTAMVANIFDRQTATVWQSSGYSGSTATTITWTPDTVTAVSRLYMQNCNFGQFEIFYNGTTTNVFTPAISSNSATAADMYFEFATQTVSSIGIKITTTYPASAEKHIGELYIGNEVFELENNPSYDNYNPYYYKKASELEMADGGMVSILFGEKFRADISLSFVSPAQHELLRSLWTSDEPFVFMPFPIANIYSSTGAWGGSAYEVNWMGNFDAMKYSSNVLGNGYSVNMQLAETPL